MGSFEPPANKLEGAPVIDALEKLGRVFFIRLQNERLQFVTLSAALASSEESPVPIFKDLQFRAHRLKGAAGIFEFLDLAAAARSLETASAEAARLHAEHTHAAVWSALVALVGMLGDIENAGPRHTSARADQQRRQPAQ